MKYFKQKIKRIVSYFIFRILPKRIFYFISSIINNLQFKKYVCINVKGLNLKFINPSYITNWRLNTFETKEPETLNWIDEFREKTIFWDIGANIGQYSIYASKKINDIEVFAFEPSVFNLEILARNIFLNNPENITIIPIPFSKKLNRDFFSFSNTDWGGALSSYSTSLNWEGGGISSKFKYKTISIDINTLIKNYELALPNYLKIDVDGNDHLILQSFGKNIKKIDEVLIEVNDNYLEHKKIIETFLISNNFILNKKEQSELIKKFPKSFHESYNQIWINDGKDK